MNIAGDLRVSNILANKYKRISAIFKNIFTEGSGG